MIRATILSLLAGLFCASAALANPYVPLVGHGHWWAWMAGILLGETFLLWLFVIDMRFGFRFLVAMLATNLVTWSTFYLCSMAVRRVRLPEVLSVAILEGLIALVEAGVLVQLSRSRTMRGQDGRRLSCMRAVLSTGLANAVSLSFGFVAFWKSAGVFWRLIPR